ncbi:MAG: polysaccharide deacetylase family protein, partial [Promethearchaeota archaeon]
MKVAQYLTILKYHYIRDLPNTPYPEIKGLLTSRFIGQLDYLQKYYEIISIEDCIKAYSDKLKLPKNACLLTFDDGIIDHYKVAFSLLSERGLTGAFFPPAEAILKNKLLNTHKIHFILAKSTDYNKLTNQIFDLIDLHRNDYNLPDNKSLKSKSTIYTSRWNSPEISLIKQLLQYILPRNLRSAICSELFEKILGRNEEDFARELYITVNQLKSMINSGMYIGGHGYSHEWLGNLSEEEQRIDIKNTYEFLEMLYNEPPLNWVISYPSSSKNETTVSI